MAALAGALWLGGCGDGGSPTTPVVKCGDPGTICTVVGNGARGFAGEGGPPESAALYYPLDLAFDPQGRLNVLDWNNFRVRRVDPDNRLRTIIGTGYEGAVQDGARGLDTPLHHAFSIGFDAAGYLYLAGNHQPQVLELDPQGIVHILAGVDTVGFGGDGQNARQARFDGPCGVAAAPGGYPIFVADTGNNRIRRIDSTGIITTIAGTGTPGFSGDGGPGWMAQLTHPYRIRYDAATQVVYVCDTENHAVRCIDATGRIWRVAGTGEPGFSGDGGPATRAQLLLPYDVAPGPGGVVYIVDTGNDRIREIAPDGTIRTVVGAGRGFSGDGGPAAAAQLYHPAAIALDARGNMWIADTYNNRIRVVWR